MSLPHSRGRQKRGMDIPENCNSWDNKSARGQVAVNVELGRTVSRMSVRESLTQVTLNVGRLDELTVVVRPRGVVRGRRKT